MNRTGPPIGREDEPGVAPLLPGPVDERRRSSIEIVRKILEKTENPRFAEECERFIREYQDGDCVLEYCSSMQSWNLGMGRAGFILLRNGRDVTSLVTRMN